MPDPIAISLSEAAELIGISRRTAYRLHHDDPTFPSYRVGALIRVSVEGLREWDQKNRKAA